jgi:hypothetical protein
VFEIRMLNGGACPRSSEWCPQSIGITGRFQSEQLAEARQDSSSTAAQAFLDAERQRLVPIIQAAGLAMR